MNSKFASIASFVVSIVAMSVLSPAAEPDDIRDPKSFVTRQIAQGAPPESTGLENISSKPVRDFSVVIVPGDAE